MQKFISKKRQKNEGMKSIRRNGGERSKPRGFAISAQTSSIGSNLFVNVLANLTSFLSLLPLYRCLAVGHRLSELKACSKT
ncbi:hypothetical protein BUQ74_13520 [Leptospira weilii serovar Heyan]|nr:hypothetical protein BUQ74_13520 [Leptospira weilii serovar Heyan]QDK24483.1 hypothetical protein FHG67_18545 [Leptospira weilii]QDK28443.1 hypothetical protein FHG68_18600 [Leptospira weilii]